MKAVDSKLILDIRYYESNIPNVNGASLPASIGTIFHFPGTCNVHGVRIARKLREIGFHCGNFDHIYVNFTNAVPENVIGFSPRTVHKENSWLRYLDFGLSPSRLNAMPDSQKIEVLLNSTFDVLRFAASGNPDMLERIQEVVNLVELHGEKLEILHKKKETERHSISVFYQIHNPGMAATALLEFNDKYSGETRRGSFLELSRYEDIFFLVSEISFKNDCVTLKPRSSFKADFRNKQYKVPIIVPIKELKTPQNDKN